MITTIVLLTLAYAILGKPIGWLVKKLQKVDWAALARNTWDGIVRYSKKAGRAAARPLLQFYYAMTGSDLSTTEKVLVYAAIVYIVVPRDFLPKSTFRWLGVLDDAGAAAFVYSKVKGGITDEVVLRTEVTLLDWFGPEIVTTPVADLGATEE